MKIFKYACCLFFAFSPIGITAQEGMVFTTDGTRTYSLTKSTLTGEKSDNVRSAIVLKPSETYQSIDGFGILSDGGLWRLLCAHLHRMQ